MPATSKKRPSRPVRRSSLQAEAAQLVRELRPVPRAVHALRAKQLARVNRGEPAVLALRGEDHDMGMQLRVRHTVALLIASQPRRGMNELRRHKTRRPFSWRSTPSSRRRTSPPRAQPGERARDSPAMRDLDLRATIRPRHRPQRRHRLRRAERQIHTRHPRPVATDAAERLAPSRRTTLHQRDELRDGGPAATGSRPSSSSASGDPCQLRPPPPARRRRSSHRAAPTPSGMPRTRPPRCPRSCESTAHGRT
jgi:hypothetical protein